MELDHHRFRPQQLSWPPDSVGASPIVNGLFSKYPHAGLCENIMGARADPKLRDLTEQSDDRHRGDEPLPRGTRPGGAVRLLRRSSGAFPSPTNISRTAEARADEQ